MSDDLKDLVTREDMPIMTKSEMRKTHENQHMQVKNINKSTKKTTKKKK